MPEWDQAARKVIKVVKNRKWFCTDYGQQNQGSKVKIQEVLKAKINNPW